MNSFLFSEKNKYKNNSSQTTRIYSPLVLLSEAETLVSNLKVFPSLCSQASRNFCFQLGWSNMLNFTLLPKTTKTWSKTKTWKNGSGILSSWQAELLILRDEKQMRWALQFVHICCLQGFLGNRTEKESPEEPDGLPDMEDRSEIPQRIRQLDFHYRVLEGGELQMNSKNQKSFHQIVA